jgi:hypothetical protein
MNRGQLQFIDCLRKEKRVRREQLGDRLLRLDGYQRRRLAAKAKALGRRVPAQIATIAMPGTLSAWHRGCSGGREDQAVQDLLAIPQAAAKALGRSNRSREVLHRIPQAGGTLHEALQKGVAQAVNFKRGGQVREAAGLKIASTGQLSNLQKAAAAAKWNYDDSLVPFFKDRNMRGEGVAKALHLDVPEAYERSWGRSRHRTRGSSLRPPPLPPRRNVKVAEAKAPQRNWSRRKLTSTQLHRS